MAWSDEPWILDGAAVRISIVGFDDGAESVKMLNGFPVLDINADLTGDTDVTDAHNLHENHGIGFFGTTKKGPFDIDNEVAQSMLNQPPNPNGRLNTDIVKRFANGFDIVRRPQNRWIIDFGVDMPLEQAALYEKPFEYVETNVRPLRIGHRESVQANKWWLLARHSPEMRNAIEPLERYIGTARVAKYRLFMWMGADVLPDGQIILFAREDDYFFGVLHSRVHEMWSLRMGTSLEDRPRYKVTTCFETFPLPWSPGMEPVDDPRVVAIGGPPPGSTPCAATGSTPKPQPGPS